MIRDFLIRLWLKGFGQVDFVLGIMILVGFFRGYRNGLAKECRLILELFTAIFLSIQFGLTWADSLSTRMNMPLYFIHGLLFALLITFFVVATKVTLKTASKIVTVTFAKTLEKVGGVLAGAIRFSVMMAIVCHGLLLFRSPHLKEAFVEQSQSGRYLVAIPTAVHYHTVRFLQYVAAVRQIT